MIRQVRIIQATAIILLVLFAAANLVGIKELWGLNFLQFFDKPVVIVALLTILPLLIPDFARHIVKSFDELGQKLSKDKKLRIRIFGTGLIVLFASFLLLPESTTLLGDGSLRVNQVESTKWWLPTEPLDFFLHAASYRFIFKPLGGSAEVCYRWLSALSGILFFCGAYRLARYLNPQKWILNFIFISSSGLIVLFFGYVESYSISASLLPWVFLAGLKTVDGAGSITSFLIFYVVASLMHVEAALIFAAGAAFTLLIKNYLSEKTIKQISGLLAVVTLAIVPVVYLARFLGLGSLDKHILSFLPNPENPQAVLTAGHWFNVLNWVFISALPGLGLAPALLGQSGGSNGNSNLRIQFALWCAVPSMLFLLFFTPQLGGPRDWDLFSLPAFTIMIAVLAAYNFKKAAGLPHQILPTLAISLWILIGFVGVNSSELKSADRQAEIIEVFPFKNLYKEYANLLVHVENSPKLQSRMYAYALKAWQQKPYTHIDSVYILNRLSGLALQNKDSSAAYTFLSLATSIDSTNVYAHMLFLNYYNQFTSLDKVLEEARVIGERFPNNLLALSALGVVYSQIDSIDLALKYYARAYQIDSNRIDIMINFGSLLCQHNQLEKGLNLLRRVYQQEPDNFLANFQLSSAYVTAGQNDSARFYLSRAKSLAKMPDDGEILNQLEQVVWKQLNSNSVEKVTTP